MAAVADINEMSRRYPSFQLQWRAQRVQEGCLLKKTTDGLVWCQVDVWFEFSMMAFIICIYEYR